MNFILDVHTHTIASGHAYSTLHENINAAKEKGLSLIALTDHAPSMPGSCGVFYFDNLNVIPKVINDVEILSGVELNIIDFDGNIDLPERIIKNLKVVIASLHSPCINFGTLDEITDCLINTMKNRYINIIGHPCDPRFPFDLEKVVKCAKDTNTLLELNNSSLKPNSHRSGGEKMLTDMLLLCKQYNHPVIIGSDAHFDTEVGDFQYAVKLLNDVSMPNELVVNTSIELLRAYLN